ncbi:1271_t:CDS:2 [Ambispora gerdemannii]|uniref:1271_t:CDS:1 n=1 Tax=Ambispora gerdemannii TaxID=144530 RepID=A0A9N9C3B3_9GLOM|nr:1271_t:CDS:2 [Ambispora gerdemannii]
MAPTKSSLHDKTEIDTTGKKHIFYVQNEKYQSLRRRNRGNNNKNPCKNCNQSNQYLETLEKRIEQISNKVNQLANATNKNQSSSLTKSESIASPDFSQMNTDALINIATHLNPNTFQLYTNGLGNFWILNLADQV